MAKTAILQSNYIPWKGYFHLIQSVDTFVIYDSVQFTKNDWRNRNKIIINGSPHWITIPVNHQRLSQSIRETMIANPKWADKHWKTIQQAYSKAPKFKDFRELFAERYSRISTLTSLSDINISLIRFLCRILEIKTEIVCDDQFELPTDRIDRLITICKLTGASTYLSGPSAFNYIDQSRFSYHGINIEWMDYGNYRTYSQNSETFSHQVSILDLLFCYGSNFKKYLRSK